MLQVLVQQLFDTAAELIQGNAELSTAWQYMAMLCPTESGTCSCKLQGPNLENQATLMENGICSQLRLVAGPCLTKRYWLVKLSYATVLTSCGSPPLQLRYRLLQGSAGICASEFRRSRRHSRAVSDSRRESGVRATGGGGGNCQFCVAHPTSVSCLGKSCPEAEGYRKRERTREPEICRCESPTVQSAWACFGLTNLNGRCLVSHASCH